MSRLFDPRSSAISSKTIVIAPMCQYSHDVTE